MMEYTRMDYARDNWQDLAGYALLCALYLWSVHRRMRREGEAFTFTWIEKTTGCLIAFAALGVLGKYWLVGAVVGAVFLVVRRKRHVATIDSERSARIEEAKLRAQPRK